MVQSKYSHSERENETYEREIWPKQDPNFWIKHWPLQFPVWHLGFWWIHLRPLGRSVFQLSRLHPASFSPWLYHVCSVSNSLRSLVKLGFHLPSFVRLSLSASLQEISSCHTLLGLCSYSTRPKGPIIIISPLLARRMLSAPDVFWSFGSKVAAVFCLFRVILETSLGSHFGAGNPCGRILFLF